MTTFRQYCDRCYHSGWHFCEYCIGQGYDPRINITCFKCDNRGAVDCTVCGGIDKPKEEIKK